MSKHRENTINLGNARNWEQILKTLLFLQDTVVERPHWTSTDHFPVLENCNLTYWLMPPSLTYQLAIKTINSKLHILGTGANNRKQA